MYGYDINGKKYEIATYKEGEAVNINGVDPSKTTETKNSDGTTTKTYKDVNGKVVYTEKYGTDKKIQNRCYYRYDSKGTRVGFTTMYYSNNIVTSSTIYDKDWKTQTHRAFNSDGSIKAMNINYQYDAKGKRTGYTSQTTKNGVTTETVYNTTYDNKGNVKNTASAQYVRDSNGMVTMYGYDINGKKYEIATYKDGEVANINGVDPSKTTETKNSDGTTTKTYKDVKGKVVYTEKYGTDKKIQNRCYYRYDSKGTRVGFTTMNYSNNVVKSATMYNKDWEKISNIAYNTNGLISTKTTYNNDKPLKQQIYTYSGVNVKKIVTKTYQNNKWVSASSLLNRKEKDSLSDIKDINGSGFWSTITRSVATSVYGKTAVDFLYAAGAGHSLSGASKKIAYGDSIYNQYSKFLNNKIQKEITNEYGYTAKDIKGYYFNSSSALSKKIASNKDFKNFVNTYKNQLKAGFSTQNGDPAKSFSFKPANSKELYYALSSVNVIKSWTDSNGKLHLIIADTYDFTNEGHGTGHGNLCAAADAAMKDGTLVPYYTLIEVVV